MRGLRWRARLILLFERLWPALWPAIGIAGLYLCLALFGVVEALPPAAHLALLGAAGIAVLVLLVRGLSCLRLPDTAAADRRLERETGLVHRPLAALADRPASPDPAAHALWQAHRSRILGSLGVLRTGWPSPGLARIDRRALRAALVVAAVAALVVAGEDGPARIAQALRPSMPALAAAPGTQIQAWITPPAFTRLPPRFLPPAGGEMRVPAGSHLTVSITGSETGAPELVLGGSVAGSVRALDATSFQADADLTEPGPAEIRRGGRDIARWAIDLAPDRPPVIAWAEPPGRAPRSLQTRLPWRATDEYGVTSVQTEFRLAARPDAPPMTVTLPVPPPAAGPQRGVGVQDLTANPWAGLDVTARLIARDGAGQTGRSEEAGFTLPERSFRNPIAQALIGARKMLSLDPNDRDSAVGVLDELLLRPEAFAGDSGGYVNLSGIYYLLVRERGAGAIPEAQARLWNLALHLEEGAAEATARALEQARENAREAMEQAARTPDDAALSELDRRLRELEEAIQRHMEALAEQARREGAIPQNDPSLRTLDSRALQRMAEQAREAARQGRMDEARQRMARLEQMLDRLRDAKPMRPGEGSKAAQQRQRARRQQGALQDMIGREGGLLDRTQQRQNAEARSDGRPQPAPRGQGTQRGDKPAPGDAAAQREADRRVQQALRRALGELMQQVGDATGEVPQSLGEAEAAMRDAAQALADQRDGEAGAAQARAVAALQKGGQEMAQAMARQRGGPGQSGEEEGEDGDPEGMSGFSVGDGSSDEEGGQGTMPGRRGRNDGRDPLGRQLGQGSSGADEGSDVHVPEEMERQRTRVIQEELRRRGADRSRPQEELEYIDRLLKPF